MDGQLAARDERVESVVVDSQRRVAVRVWPGANPPLVMLHGVLSTSATWRSLANMTDRACIAVDLPGFGHSSGARAERLDSYVEDVMATLRLLGVDRYGVVGHSFGGAVATAIAARDDRVEELLLLAPSGHGRSLLVPLALNRSFGPALLIVLTCTNTLASRRPSHEVSSRVARLRLVASEMRRATRDAPPKVRTAVRAVERETLEGDAARRCAERYRGPVTIAWGTEDRVLPVSQVDTIRRTWPRARLHILTGAGHALHRERPEAIARLLASRTTPPVGAR